MSVWSVKVPVLHNTADTTSSHQLFPAFAAKSWKPTTCGSSIQRKWRVAAGSSRLPQIWKKKNVYQLLQDLDLYFLHTVVFRCWVWLKTHLRGRMEETSAAWLDPFLSPCRVVQTSPWRSWARMLRFVLLSWSVMRFACWQAAEN